MGIYKINGFNAILVILLLLGAVNVFAETTFFDNPDDAFIVGSSAAEGAPAERGTAGGGCAYNWNCSNWSECLPSGKQTRNCANTGACSDAYNPPEIEQNCSYISSPEIEKAHKELENKTETQTTSVNQTITPALPITPAQIKPEVITLLGLDIFVITLGILIAVLVEISHRKNKPKKKKQAEKVEEESFTEAEPETAEDT